MLANNLFRNLKLLRNPIYHPNYFYATDKNIKLQINLNKLGKSMEDLQNHVPNIGDVMEIVTIPDNKLKKYGQNINSYNFNPRIKGEYRKMFAKIMDTTIKQRSELVKMDSDIYSDNQKSDDLCIQQCNDLIKEKGLELDLYERTNLSNAVWNITAFPVSLTINTIPLAKDAFKYQSLFDFEEYFKPESLSENVLIVKKVN